MTAPEIDSPEKLKSWEFVDLNQMPRGTFTKALKVNYGGEASKVYWIQGRVKVFKRVPIVKDTIVYGQRFTKSNVNLELRDITYTSNRPIDFDFLDGKVAKHTLSRGRIVWENDIKREKALRNGDVINVSIGIGNWKISLKGLAKESGFIGDIVKIQNMKSKEMLSGVIVAKGEVQIQ